MLQWRRLPAWTLRAWPVLAIVPFAVFHYIALAEFAHSSQLVNKLMGMTLQLIGGSVILWAIDENLGLFRKRSLRTSLVSWLRDFPVRNAANTVILVGSGSASTSGHATVTAATLPNTIEERLLHLEQGLKAVRQDLQEGLAAAQRQLSAAKTELGVRIDAAAGQVADLSSRVERATVGGFKAQLFGVLLAVYGAGTSVFA